MWTNVDQCGQLLPVAVVKTVLVITDITGAGLITMQIAHPLNELKEPQDKNIYDDEISSFFTLWQR